VIGRLPSLAVLGLAGALLQGCGGDPYPGQPQEGTLRVPLIAEMKGFDPTQVDEEISHTCVVNVYDQLYEYHYLKRPFELVPCLASALPEVSADRLTLTIRMKPGITFHDDPCFEGGKGREVTSHDAAFCLKRLMDGKVHSPSTWLIEGKIVGLDAFHEETLAKGAPENPYRSRYPDVEGLSTPDPHTLVIRLTEPYEELVWVLAMPAFSIYPPEAIARYGRRFNEHPVSTGPYLLESYSRAQRMVLVKRPGYRDERYPSEGAPGDAERGRLDLAGQRLPLNDRVIATVFRETQPMWLYFESGFLDRTGIPKDNFEGAVDTATGALKGLFADRNVLLEKDPRIEIIYDLFNFDDPVVGAKAGEKGRALRRAMSLTNDQEWARTHLYNNRVERVDGPLLEEFPEFDPTFVNPWKRGKDETMEQARERARKILADAGMPGGQGVPDLHQDVGDSSLDDQHFVAFQDDLKAIGLKLKPNKVTWQEQILRQREAKFQMGGLSWGADYPAAQNFLQLFYGPFRSPNSNSSNYANPEFDDLYKRSLAMPPGAERTAAYRRMQQIVVDDCVWIFRYRRTQWGLSHAWLKGYRYNDLSTRYFKYCQVKAEDRVEKGALWNPVRVGPALIGLAVVAALVGLTMLAGRRRVRGW
jgi:oligopeptide transport system substrate-binding protein